LIASQIREHSMSTKLRQTFSFVLVTLLVGLMLHSCQAFEQPPEGVLTPQELVFTSAAETMAANLTPEQTIVPRGTLAITPLNMSTTSLTATPVQALATLATQTKEPSPTTSPAAVVTQTPAPTSQETVLPGPTDVSEIPTATEINLPTSTPFGTAIQVGTPTPRSTTPTPVFSVVFEDDFTIRAGWHTENQAGFEMYYQGGGYRIHNRGTNSNLSSIRNFEYADMRVEVEAALVSGPLSSYYGVVCRWQDLQNLYAFVLGSDGFHAIVKIQDMEVSFLEESRAEDDSIQLEGGINRITGLCQGSQLVLEVNGQRLLETEDSTFESGNAGLLVGNRGQPGSLVHFDNFALLAR
jgi:hypothetical protein